MPQYRTPGVYVHEVPLQTPAGIHFSPVDTGFVGIAPRGPVGEAVLVTSWQDYMNKFARGLSPFLEDAYLSYCIYGYFLNGGSVAWVVRVTDGGEDTATVTLDDGMEVDIVKVDALDPGAWGNKLEVNFTVNEVNSANYDLEVKLDGEVVEVFKNMSLDENEARFMENLINGISRFIKVEVLSTESIGSVGVDVSLEGGNDGGSPGDQDYIDAFEHFNFVEMLGIIVCPESQEEAVITGGIDYCRDTRKDATFFAEGEEIADKDAIKALSTSLASDYRSLIYPWIEVNDPLSKSSSPRKWIPASGHYAGIVSRIANNRHIYKAPAGTDAFVRGAIKLKTRVLDTEQADLNAAGVNVIREFTNYGIVVWGARVKPDTEDEGLLYLNHRLGLNYIKNWLRINTQWAVFEVNNPDLWRRLTVFCKSFLLTEYEKGGFKGETPAETFFVKCDAELNQPDTVKEGKVFVEIGVAIAEPAEFVIFRIGMWDGGSSVEEV